MQYIAESWKSLSPEEKKKYEVNTLTPKIQEADQGPKGTKIKIKHTFDSMGGLQLDGYVYFAQKMRQTEFKDRKVKNILQLIKEKWDGMTDSQRADYDKKAHYVSQQMKCRKYQSENLLEKRYH